jgi:hypothetical protein
MKNLLIIISLLYSAYSFGQKDTITSSVNWPLGIVEKDNYLFIAEADDNKITKIDLSVSNPIPTTVISGLSRPNFLLCDGSYLYFTEYNAGVISKIDINQINPIKDTVISGLNSPKDLLLNNTDLYFTTPTTIFKIDISLSNPDTSTVISGLNGPIGLELNGTELYYSEYNGNIISKIDISLPNPVPSIVISGLNGPIGGMSINGSELYFAEYGSSEISKINITDPNPTITNVDYGVSAADFAFVGNDLYVSDFLNNLILKYSEILTSVSLITKTSVKIYPNPSSDFITFEGVQENLNCTIYNVLGSKVDDFIVFDKLTLDVSSFMEGTYLFVFENGLSKKVIVK